MTINRQRALRLEDGVYYNKYMSGNKIKMAQPLNKDSVNYSDGTVATQEQLAKDVVTFLTWASEPTFRSSKKNRL